MRLGSRQIFLFISAGIFVYLILRAIFVPLAHDEAETFFIYFVNGHFLPYQGWVSANNHFLNSFLGHLAFLWIGPWNWAIRIPNLIFFPIYAYFLYRLAEGIQNKLIQWCLMLAMLSAVLLIEFFALARGYGMGMALLLAYLFHVISYLRNNSLKHYFFQAILGVLMLFASLTCFYVFVLTSFLIALSLIEKDDARRMKGLVFLIFNLLPLGYFIQYTLHLGKINELVVGTLSGMYEETVAPMAYWLFGSEGLLWTSLFFIAFLFILVDLVGHFLAKRFIAALLDHQFTFQFLFIGSLLIIAVNGYLLDIPFPRDRAALFLIPLLFFSIATGLDRSGSSFTPYLALILLYFPLNFLASANLSHSHYWKSKRINPAYYDYILEHSKGDLASIGSMSLRETIWYHQIFSHDQKLNPLYITNPVNNNSTDFIIQPDSINMEILDHYDLVMEDKVSGNNLYERKIKLARVQISKGQLSSYVGKDLYHDILITEPDSLLYQQPALLDLDLTISSSRVPIEYSLILNALDDEGKIVQRQVIRLSRLKYNWDDEKSYRILFDLGRLSRDVNMLQAFILNNNEEAYQIKEGSFKIHILVQQ